MVELETIFYLALVTVNLINYAQRSPKLVTIQYLTATRLFPQLSLKRKPCVGYDCHGCMTLQCQRLSVNEMLHGAGLGKRLTSASHSSDAAAATAASIRLISCAIVRLGSRRQARQHGRRRDGCMGCSVSLRLYADR